MSTQPGKIDRRSLLAASVGLAALAQAPRLRAREAGTLRPLRLSANENPWGPGPAARAALLAHVDEGSRYGMRQMRELTAAIAAHEGVRPSQVVLGSGSGELLHMLALGWCRDGRIVCAWPTFNQLMSFAEKLGAQVERVPLDAELRHDLAALRAATQQATSLLYLCNPNNPTGTAVAADALRETCVDAAARSLVVVDEAYIELADPAVTASMLPLVRDGAAVVLLRTFSKLHGMAGLRVGYALAREDIAQQLRRMQMATPNTPGLAAATASLGDHEFLARTRAALLADRARVCALCDELGVRHARPEGNFVFAHVGMPLPQFAALMRDQQIEVGRPFEPYNDWCRISIGTTAETDILLDALRRTLRRS